MKGNIASNVDNIIENTIKASTNVTAFCIAKISTRYYLLVESAIKIPGIEIGPIVAIRLKDDQAKGLISSGIEKCITLDDVPQSTQGFVVNFKSILSIDGESFLVFDSFKTSQDIKHQIILVSAKSCPIIDETF